jgi:hypothetical protein
MAVDGKNLRVGKVVSACVWMFLLVVYSLPAFAENLQQLQIVDLKNDICDVTQIQINTPPLGMEFISEDKAVAFAVCVGSGTPKLAIRDQFEESSSQHLKAAVFDVVTGKVEHHFDWPTHGDQSFVGVTKNGNLLVVRDNILDTFDVEGKRLAHLQLKRAKLQDPLLMAPSYATGTIAVTELAMTVSKIFISATLVLDEDTLRPVFQWSAINEMEDRVIAASQEIAAGWQQVNQEKHVVVRKPNDKEWTTIWKGMTTSIFGPQFLDATHFVMATDGAVQIYDANGEIDAQTVLRMPMQFSVSKNGKFLVVAAPEFSSSSLFSATMRIEIFNTSFKRMATTTNFADQKRYFVLALSPSGKRLAMMGDMQVKVFNIKE